MKVGLNATCFNDRPSGARQRFLGIYGELFKRLQDTEFVIYEPSDCRVGSWFVGMANVSVRQTPIPSEGRIQRLTSGIRFWGAELERERFDIFENFHLPLIKAPTGRSVLTIHDIRGINSGYGPFLRPIYKMILDRSIKEVDHVITVSATMKEEIIKYYPYAKISVIYNGVKAHGFDGISESDKLVIRHNLALPEEFILAVGHFEERKNYLRLIESISKLRDKGRICSLVIIGNDSGGRDVLVRRVESLNLSGHVQILSGLSDQEVQCAYKLCNLFVFPSAYEGFGIPILEAMAADCPVILSDIPVFREITQNQGIYFPCDDIELMACAIERGLTSCIDREQSIEYGRGRVKDFGFQILATKLADLYRDIL